ncbi:aKG-HExxH-type peptide beta-hydroxylase [Streptomyces sp. NPDC001380]|uniref:aKG-HExxH-type peptide beta-hydroxylase n=1 Tax=Streptomyces sp. NPDC001380 TaxID=3364566 RepID=UPI00368E31C5
MEAPTADPLLPLAAVQRFHRTRIHRIRAVIQPTALQPAVTPASASVDYALAHHVLEGAEAAARRRDIPAFDWYRGHPDANVPALSTATVAGPRAVLAPELARLPRSPISETPYYVLGPDSAAAPDGLRELAVTAYATAAEAGFGALLADHAVVLCLLRPRRLGETLDSWTITRLPGTVFCDHAGDPVVLARDLIHEAGHNWLNDALTATGTKIREEERFFSPWKGTNRPAFGFLHACWAFPLTMLYTARVLDRTSGDLRCFLTAYLNQQRGLLARTADDHARALALVPDPDLLHRLRVVHREALSL